MRVVVVVTAQVLVVLVEAATMAVTARQTQAVAQVVIQVEQVVRV
jgi:hypothetical protein